MATTFPDFYLKQVSSAVRLYNVDPYFTFPLFLMNRPNQTESATFMYFVCVFNASGESPFYKSSMENVEENAFAKLDMPHYRICVSLNSKLKKGLNP
jgi:hypothetical protein